MNVRVMVCRATVATALTVLAASAAAQERQAEPALSSMPAAAPSKAQKAADRQLRKRVARALGRAKRLDANRLLIFVRGDVVTLSGDVADSEQSALAIGTAQRVPGVGEVRNQLRIRARN
ncbi:transport-associated protein [Burkholderia lata]|uniref:BON domain-containing protein n=1 Tax=Burkholderia lata (strain ATCC 17760 / DSM 23089 / LMG 22485 / NCIMB 9086 / R18194 / 383) TaxID=482957 RepID=UPI001452CD2B|nr:BON domain-containing protein [Burkholderia lata]VWC77550.1 transport-associated protein [Burkholderia lata]